MRRGAPTNEPDSGDAGGVSQGGVLCSSDSDFMSASRVSCAMSHSRLLQDF